MNRSTRAAKKIHGSTFEIVCKDPSRMRVLQYSQGVLSELHPSYDPIDNNMYQSFVQADVDGYYFVISGRNSQILKKGDIENRIFLVDHLMRDDLDLSPESYNDDGEKIGDNNFSYIGSGIYEIIPLSLDKTVVKVFGNLYSSYPIDDISDNCNDDRVSTTLTIGLNRKKTGITIGGSDIISRVQEQKVNLKIAQTIFRV
jgi:hypothetical protein